MTALPKPTREDRPRRLRDTGQDLALARPETFRDAKYRRWVAEGHQCSIKGVSDHKCGPWREQQPPAIDFAHIGTGGKGLKASDRDGIPLCRAAHMEQHAIGWNRFAIKYDIDPRAIAADLWATWEKRGAR
jgi:hypothetical protein